MKQWIIAAVVLLLLIDCKSRVLRELDKIEAEIPNAIITEDLGKLFHKAVDLDANYNFNEKERTRYREVWLVLMKAARCKFAKDFQRLMREHGYSGCRARVVGHDEDILVVSLSSHCKKEDVYLLAKDPNVTLAWGRVEFRKVILRNSYGTIYTWKAPVYTWEP